MNNRYWYQRCEKCRTRRRFRCLWTTPDQKFVVRSCSQGHFSWHDNFLGMMMDSLKSVMLPLIREEINQPNYLSSFIKVGSSTSSGPYMHTSRKS